MSDAVTASELLYALQHGSPLPQAFAAQLQEASPSAVYDFVAPLPPRAAPRAAASSPRVAPSLAAPTPDSPASDEQQATTHRCSQCKQDRGLDEFPTRLTTLQPFLVCKSHLWYWTPAKRELHWAPEGVSTMETVCSEVQEVVSGQRAAGSWIVKGVAEDRNAIVMRIAAVQGWVALPVAMRKSRASGPAPPPPHHYQLKKRGLPEVGPTWRLIVTYHDSQQKHVVAFKKDVGRKPGTWAKLGASKKEVEDLSNVSEQAPEDERESAAGTPRAQPMQQQPQQQIGRRTGINPSHPAPRVDSTPPPLDPSQAEIEVNAEAFDSIQSFSTSDSHRRARSITTSELPSLKRARRVEPSLVQARALASGPHPSSSDANPSPGFASPLPAPDTPHSILVHPPTPARAHPEQPTLIAPRAAFAQLPSSSTRSTNESSSADPPSSSTPLFSSTFVPPSAHHRRTPIQPLTLDELLASPYTDPPQIPLRQRTMQLNAAAYYASTNAARARSTSEGATSAGGTSATGRERDRQQRGGSRAAGIEPSSDIANMFDDGDLESEEEEAMATDGGEEEEEEESEEEDDDGDGGDWLTGLVKGELIGLGQASQEEIDELESGGEDNGGEE